MSLVNASLRIERLAYGGTGVGRVTEQVGRMDKVGKVVFVPNTVPGDDVDVVITEEKKRYASGRVIALRRPSSERRNPPCPYVPRCGGCPWQQATYPEQLHAKESLVRENMRRIGGMADPPILPIIPSPQEWRYRHRIRLRTESPRRLGFYQAQSHELVEPADCLIAGKNSATHLACARDWLAQLQTLVRRVELVTSDPICNSAEGVVLMGNAEGPFRTEDDEVCATFLRAYTDVSGLILFGRGWRRTWGETHIVLDLGVGGFTLVVKNGGFTQVNPAANRVLIKALLQLGEFDVSQTVIECYSGGGNLSLPIAAHSRKLFGIEQDANAIADARDNSARLGLQNVEFIHASAQTGLETLLRRNVQADVVVLDPPRAGAVEILKAISQLGATKIVYVSCDPTTLARDLRRLGQNGYRVESLQPIDFFPQTYHVETIAVAVLT